MQKRLPLIIQQVGFTFDWDVEKVWALDYPVEEIPIQELVWHFDIPFWNTERGFYNLKPKAVIEHPEKYEIEYQRMMAADLSHPIDIMQNKGKWLILDGLHRLAKAKMLGQATVLVRKIPRAEIPRIRTVLESGSSERT